MDPMTKTVPTPCDACREQDSAGGSSRRPVLLVVSFGTSYNETRGLTIGAVEEALARAYPQYEVRRSFTSQIILDILKQRDHLEIDNVTQAMERLVADGVKEVVVQPTHVMTGFEYDDVITQISAYRDRFDSMKVGRPLLVEQRDYAALVQALAEETAPYNTPGTAIVFMGHGTEHRANDTYTKLQRQLNQAGYHNYFIGTVEATPTVEDVLAQVQKTDATAVVLLPLMVVAGDHATNDMAGEEEGTWQAVFAGAGYQTRCILRGLGQYPAVQQMFIDHVADALREDPVWRSPSQIQQVLLPGQIADGEYAITVASSSSMFRVVECRLRVERGAMTATMTMSGDGYGWVYLGSSTQAEAAPERNWIPRKTDGRGAPTFTVPVPALNQEIRCAAWSCRKEMWYDRVLVFRGDNLPAQALAAR